MTDFPRVTEKLSNALLEYYRQPKLCPRTKSSVMNENMNKISINHINNHRNRQLQKLSYNPIIKLKISFRSHPVLVLIMTISLSLPQPQ